MSKQKVLATKSSNCTINLFYKHLINDKMKTIQFHSQQTFFFQCFNIFLYTADTIDGFQSQKSFVNFLIFSKWYIYNIQQHRAELFYTCSHSIGNRTNSLHKRRLHTEYITQFVQQKKNWLFIWLAINFFRSKFFYLLFDLFLVFQQLWNEMTRFLFRRSD